METFKTIPGFPDYQVGDLGTVKSLKRSKEKTLTAKIDRQGYMTVYLYKNGAKNTVNIHRLVAIAHIPNPDNKRTVNHKDGNKLNNQKSNLEWATQAENNQHAYDTGLNSGMYGNNNPNAKLTPEQVQEIRNLKGQKSCREISRIFNISIAQISRLHTRKNWT